MKTAALILTVLLSTAVSAQAQEPASGYAPINGLNMYYEIHGSGSGEPLVLLHGSFMTISNNWTGWIDELSKTRKVIAVEMQGHGRTADINRDVSYENLADRRANRVASNEWTAATTMVRIFRHDLRQKQG